MSQVPGTLPRSGRQPFERHEAVDLAVVTALIVVPLWSFRTSYGGVGFLAVGLIGLVLATGLLALARVLRWPPVVTVIACAVIYPVVGAILIFPYLNLLGVIPTPVSMYETVRVSVTGWKTLITTEPPVGSGDGLFVIPFGLGYVGAALMLAASQRRVARFVVLVLPFVILGLGIATGTTHPVVPYVEGIVTTAVAVSWLAWHEHRRRPSVETSNRKGRRAAGLTAYLAAAAAIGAGVAHFLPFEHDDRYVWRQDVVPPFDPRVYPSPLSGYRHYVKIGADASEGVDRPMFTVTGLPAGVALRLATMDSYDGVVWQVSGGDPDNPSLDDSGSFQRVGTKIPTDVDGPTVDVTVEIDEYSDVWIPTVGEVVSLTFEGSEGGPERDRELQRSFRYNRDTDTAATPLGLHAGDRYRMSVVLPTTVGDLTTLPVDTDRSVGRATTVPVIGQTLISPELLQLPQPGQRLDAIRSEMYRFGVYSDGDPTQGQAPSRAGHSAGRLSEFAQEYPKKPLIGNAEQYAATYALAFRELGDTPTRVVMGFEPDRASVDGPLVVVQTDVEAWAEVPTQNGGWVWISPTPPRDQNALTTSQPQRPEPDYRSQKPDPPAVRDPDFKNAATTEGDAKQEEPEPDKPTTDDGSSLVPSWPVSGVLGTVMAVVAFPFGLLLLAWLTTFGLKFGRRMLRRRRGSSDRQVASGWYEVEDYTVDLGKGLEPTATRRENAVVAGGAAVALAERTDGYVWSADQLDPQTVDLYWREVSETLRSMRSELGWRERLRASLSLRSFRYRMGRRS